MKILQAAVPGCWGLTGASVGSVGCCICRWCFEHAMLDITGSNEALRGKFLSRYTNACSS
jgi:hypothetical protein